MEELIDGNWQIDSAVESEIIGRVAMYGNTSVAGTKFIFKHPQEIDTTADEVEFVRRELQYGKLVIGRQYAEPAEAGLKAIVDSGETFNGVTQEVANICLQAIRKSREIRARRLKQAEDTLSIAAAA